MRDPELDLQDGMNGLLIVEDRPQSSRWRVTYLTVALCQMFNGLTMILHSLMTYLHDVTWVKVIFSINNDFGV